MRKTNNVLCPVCGKYTFNDVNNFDICKYCGWQNDGYYEAGGANELSLEEFRKRYQETITSNPDFIWKNCGYPEKE